MVSYGPIYEFAFDSQNGADILIVISKKEYTGAVTRRPLGRAPILKRENNGVIYGTSLEIYAECKIDGEYADIYTSSADEFKVDVWKDEVIIWTGFITPELYSEPDIAPPYDVQIIATDGIGELKNFSFETEGSRSIYDHLRQMLDHVELARGFSLISSLTFDNGAVQSGPGDLFKVMVDLGHEVGESCYDVIQRLLTSFNAKITLYRDKWVIFRETDFIRMAYGDELSGVHNNGQQASFSIVSFGSMDETSWWPIGQMTSVIEPAKKSLTLKAPNNYKDNAFSASWISGNAATYNNAEDAYVLPDEGSYIMQELDFSGEEVGNRLALRVSARNVGGPDENLDVGIRVKIDALVSSGYGERWLVPVEELTGDKVAGYGWDFEEGWIKGKLAIPMASDTSSDAQDIDIVIPLYDNRLQGVNTTSWIYARSIEVTIFNPSGAHDIYVYGVSLQPYEQFEGYQANVSINNGARENANEVTFSLSDGSRAMPAAVKFMTGLPLSPGSNTPIKSWRIGNGQNQDYLSAMSEDYAMAVALPRMMYKGSLNVPRRILPFLFRRDNTLYFPQTYSYNLLEDELEVDMISIPSADVIIHSVSITAIAGYREAQKPGSGSGSGSGGSTSVDIIHAWDSYDESLNQALGANLGIELLESVNDIYDYIGQEQETFEDITERLIALEDKYEMFRWVLDEDGNILGIETDYDLYSFGTLASGGRANQGTADGSGGIMGVIVNGEVYTDDDNDRLVVLPDYPTTVAELADAGDYIRRDEIGDIIGGGGDYSELSARLGVVEDDILLLAGRMDDAEEGLTAHGERLNVAESDIVDLRDGMTQIDLDIANLKAEDERLAAIIENLGAVAEMFVWDDEEHTRIRTDFDLFSKGTIGSGGKATPSGEEGGGGDIDLSDYATINYVNENFLGIFHDADGTFTYVDIMEADSFYAYAGGIHSEGNISTEGNLTVDGEVRLVGKIYVSDNIYLDDDKIITFAQGNEIYGNQGGLVLRSTQGGITLEDNVHLGKDIFFDELQVLNIRYGYGDDDIMVEIWSEGVEVFSDFFAPTINSPTIDDIYDRISSIEKVLNLA